MKLLNRCNTITTAVRMKKRIINKSKNIVQSRNTTKIIPSANIEVKIIIIAFFVNTGW